jgi:hypothetical protein
VAKEGNGGEAEVVRAVVRGGGSTVVVSDSGLASVTRVKVRV